MTFFNHEFLLRNINVPRSVAKRCQIIVISLYRNIGCQNRSRDEGLTRTYFGDLKRKKMCMVQKGKAKSYKLHTFVCVIKCQITFQYFSRSLDNNLDYCSLNKGISQHIVILLIKSKVSNHLFVKVVQRF